MLRPAASASLLILLVSLHAGAAQPVPNADIRTGFVVEKVFSPKDMGSWVCMCFDPKGRLYVSSEGGQGLFRVTIPAPGAAGECQVELVSKHWGHCQGLAFVGNALYAVQHGNVKEPDLPPDALLRLTDTDGDDKLDKAEPLLQFAEVAKAKVAWYEHHVHAVAPGPDGTSLYIISGDRNPLPCDKGRTPKLWNRDSWDHPFTKTPFPGGWVVKTDLDGKNPEYVCMGLRNGYDIAFNRRGDLFTFDSDLEYDVGLPNYRPTAIRHILAGLDGGWAGSANEMEWSWTPKWEEVQPPVRDIGPGSPTGVCFGYGAAFPAPYQEALFVCDWTFGRIFAAQLAPHGATYRADVELFFKSKGMPIADIAVSPTDGAMYFVTGGRGAGSSLYRIVYRGAESTAPAKPVPPAAEAVALHDVRRRLEAFHGAPDPRALAVAWPLLGHADRIIRLAARSAVEWQPVAEWKPRALAERDPRTALQALLALARATTGDASVQPEVLAALEKLDFATLTPDEQCWYLRIITISASRHGMPPADVFAPLAARLRPALPSADRRVNEELAAMFAAFKCGACIPTVLDLLDRARGQEEQIAYTDALVKLGTSDAWTPALRERFFGLVAERAPRWKGGPRVKPRIEAATKAAVAMLDDAQRSRLAAAIEALQKPPAAVPDAPRSLVKQWTMADLVPGLEAGLKKPRDLANGKRLYTVTTCAACHAFQGEGGLSGPDLTNVRGRYTPHDLLDNILSPSKVINQQYGQFTFLLHDGRQITGRPLAKQGDVQEVGTDPTNPRARIERIKDKDVESMQPSPLSAMPAGLLDTLTEDDILDLVAYLIDS